MINKQRVNEYITDMRNEIENYNDSLYIQRNKPTDESLDFFKKIYNKNNRKSDIMATIFIYGFDIVDSSNIDRELALNLMKENININNLNSDDIQNSINELLNQMEQLNKIIELNTYEFVTDLFKESLLIYKCIELNL